MQKGFKYFVFLSLLIVSACATSPEGRMQLALISNSRMREDGERAFTRIKNRSIIDNTKSDNDYVRCVTNALNEALPAEARGQWDIAILKDSNANAFALPGNKIAVNSGLLRVAVNEDQLATALAHEIGHILAGHGQERASQQRALASVGSIANIIGRSSTDTATAMTGAAALVQVGLLYPFAKVQEEEADLIGLSVMAKAGFRPQEAIEFWKNMEVYGGGGSDSFLSTHPSHQARMEKLRERIAEAKVEANLPRPACEDHL